MKKMTVMLSMFFLTGLIGCFCSGIPEKWTLVGLELTVYDYMGNRAEESPLQGDSIELMVYLEPEFSATFPVAPLVNTLYATSCPGDGYEGMTDEIESITITSDNDYNDYPAGESLNELMQFGRENLDEFMERDLDWQHEYLGRLRLTIREKPDLPRHVFTVTVGLESGEIVTGTTEEVIWE